MYQRRATKPAHQQGMTARNVYALWFTVLTRIPLR